MCTLSSVAKDQKVIKINFRLFFQREGGAMADKQRIVRTLVLDAKKDREKVLKNLEDTGVKVVHDSGERVLEVELPEKNETDIKKTLPNIAKLVVSSSDVPRKLPKLSDNEKLYVDALKLRTSKAFIDERKRRKPGSTKEEKELFQASCIPEENAK
jgi:hypothetical protein